MVVERTSAPDEKAEAAVTEVTAGIETVVIKVEGRIVKNLQAMMKIVGTKIQAIVQDLHTEIRTDFKLKQIG